MSKCNAYLPPGSLETRGMAPVHTDDGDASGQEDPDVDNIYTWPWYGRVLRLCPWLGRLPFMPGTPYTPLDTPLDKRVTGSRYLDTFVDTGSHMDLRTG